MKLRVRQQEEPEINLTPLIDVVFLMLIFFMVTTTFIQEGNLAVNLPEASPEPSAVPAESVELVIDARGDYFLAGRPLVNRQSRTLVLAFQGLLDEGPVRLVIRADGATPHQAVVTALDAAGQVGISNIAIATVPESHE